MSLKSGDFTITIELEDNGKISLGLDGEFYVRPSDDNGSIMLNDDILTLIRLLQDAEREVTFLPEKSNGK